PGRAHARRRGAGAGRRRRARAHARRRLPHPDRSPGRERRARRVRRRHERCRMTTTTFPLPLTGTRTRPRLLKAASDTLAITWRNLLMFKRVPQLMVFSFIQPVIFVLMFRYVFGGAIRVPGVPYVDYLMPGIFAQTVAFGAINTGVGLAGDLGTGLIERFRSLPMPRSAVLAARTAADVVRNVIVVALMCVVGFA